MSDTTWARYARLVFWMTVALVITAIVKATWPDYERNANNLSNYWMGILVGRYILWHEQIAAWRK